MTEIPIPTLGERYNALISDLLIMWLEDYELDDLFVDPALNTTEHILDFVKGKNDYVGGMALVLLAIVGKPAAYAAIMQAAPDMPGHIQKMIVLAGLYFDDGAPFTAAEKLRDAADAMQVMADQRAKTEGLPPAVHGANNAGVV